MADEPFSLRLTGACTGCVEACPSTTVSALKSAIVRSLLTNDIPGALRLVASGGRARVLEDAATLAESGITAATRLLVLRGAAEAPGLAAAESRQQRLERLLASAKALAERSGSGRDAYRLELEAQDGVFSSELDKQAVLQGMLLHAQGKRLLAQGSAADAEKVLELCLNFFDSVTPADLARIDNPSLAGLDWCWALYLIRDSSRLAQAGSRLAAARAGLTRAHGSELDRLSSASPLASYVRLEVLEGVGAFLLGDAAGARAKLLSARQRGLALRCGPDAVAALAALGFSAAEACLALRSCGGDVNAASGFAFSRRDAATARAAQRRAERRARRELESLGRTPTGKLVDSRQLDSLMSMGYERRLAAAALLRAENELGAALDTLSDPDSNAALQASMESAGADARRRAERRAAQAQLTGMGFSEAGARTAMRLAGGDVAAATELLLSGGVEEEEEEAEGEAVEEAEAAGEQVDEEMERELAGAVRGAEGGEGYELDVEEELEAANKHLAMLDSAAAGPSA